MKKDNPHRSVTYDKTGFRILDNGKIKLSIPKDLKKYLHEKHGINIDSLVIDTGLNLKGLDIINIRIHPYRAYDRLTFKLQIVYRITVKQVQPETDTVMAIDYGSKNFASIVIEGLPEGYLIDGGYIKSLLRKYLKKISKLQSKRDLLKNENRSTKAVDKKLHKLQKRVNNLLRDFSHKVSNLILGLAAAFKV